LKGGIEWFEHFEAGFHAFGAGQGQGNQMEAFTDLDNAAA
jgi:hypothetical protein